MPHSFDPVILHPQPTINEIKELCLEVTGCLKHSDLTIDEKETVLGIFKTIDQNETLILTTSKIVTCTDGFPQVIVGKEEMEKLSVKKLWREGVLVEWISMKDKPIRISTENHEMFDLISPIIQELAKREFEPHREQEQNFEDLFNDILAERYSNGDIGEREFHRLLTRIITVFPIESYYPKVKIQNSEKAIYLPHKLLSLLKMCFVNLLRYYCIQDQITVEEYEETMIELDFPFRSIYKVKPLILCEHCEEKNPIGSLFCIGCQSSLIN